MKSDIDMELIEVGRNFRDCSDFEIFEKIDKKCRKDGHVQPNKFNILKAENDLSNIIRRDKQ